MSLFKNYDLNFPDNLVIKDDKLNIRFDELEKFISKPFDRLGVLGDFMLSGFSQKEAEYELILCLESELNARNGGTGI